jgi:hypothetical protein
VQGGSDLNKTEEQQEEEELLWRQLGKLPQQSILGMAAVAAVT